MKLKLIVLKYETETDQQNLEEEDKRKFGEFTQSPSGRPGNSHPFPFHNAHLNLHVSGGSLSFLPERVQQLLLLEGLQGQVIHLFLQLMNGVSSKVLLLLRSHFDCLE